ncbi:MAG: helix-turn-helix domain-containing protein [Thermocrispum sp.]
MPSSQERLRLAVAALLYVTGETQRDLAGGIGRGQPEVSRRQSGTSAWTLDDLDRLAAHFGIAAGDLLCGADHAVTQLPTPRRATADGGTQAATSTPDPEGQRR